MVPTFTYLIDGGMVAETSGPRPPRLLCTNEDDEKSKLRPWPMHGARGEGGGEGGGGGAGGGEGGGSMGGGGNGGGRAGGGGEGGGGDGD
eukprot:7341295-Prymnesium_polylepis.2